MYKNSPKKCPRSKIEKVACINYFKSCTDQEVEKEFGLFLVAAQLIHRLTQADISCTTTAHLSFTPLLDTDNIKKDQIFDQKIAQIMACLPKLFIFY